MSLFLLLNPRFIASKKKGVPVHFGKKKEIKLNNALIKVENTTLEKVKAEQEIANRETNYFTKGVYQDYLNFLKARQEKEELILKLQDLLTYKKNQNKILDLLKKKRQKEALLNAIVLQLKEKIEEEDIFLTILLGETWEDTQAIFKMKWRR